LNVRESRMAIGAPAGTVDSGEIGRKRGGGSMAEDGKILYVIVTEFCVF
jgi:hypothetical protein